MIPAPTTTTSYDLLNAIIKTQNTKHSSLSAKQVTPQFHFWQAPHQRCFLLLASMSSKDSTSTSTSTSTSISSSGGDGQWKEVGRRKPGLKKQKGQLVKEALALIVGAGQQQQQHEKKKEEKEKEKKEKEEEKGKKEKKERELEQRRPRLASSEEQAIAEQLGHVSIQDARVDHQPKGQKGKAIMSQEDRVRQARYLVNRMNHGQLGDAATKLKISPKGSQKVLRQRVKTALCKRIKAPPPASAS